MLTLDPTGRLYPDQRGLSSRAAERHAHLSAVRAGRRSPQRSAPRLSWLAPTVAVYLRPELSLLRRTS
jgi:hypothetical protein